MSSMFSSGPTTVFHLVIEASAAESEASRGFGSRRPLTGPFPSVLNRMFPGSRGALHHRPQ